MKRVLVTGASGFVGRQCLPLLSDRGFEVHAVGYNEIHQSVGVEWHRVDLLDQSAMASMVTAVAPSHLLHLAWHPIRPGNTGALEGFRWVQATLGLVEAFSAQGGNRLVAAGSCFEYDMHYGYCSERLTPLNPASVYGTCKAAVSTLLETFSERVGLSSAWGRIFFLYGPYEARERLVSSVATSLLTGEVAACSHGKQIRDYMHVHDGADALVALLDSTVEGPVNIASGQPVILSDIIYGIARRIGREDMVRLGAVATSPSEPRLVVADVTRLSQELGWRPNFDLKSGLDDTVSWWASELEQSSRPAAWSADHSAGHHGAGS